MLEPYYLLNLCLRELQDCGLSQREKQEVESHLVSLKSMVLEAKASHPQTLVGEAHTFDRLYHLVRHVCALDYHQDDLDRLLVHLACLSSTLTPQV